MDESEVLATFVAITGADEAQALSLLEASNFNLEEAVNLHMAMNDGHQGSAGAGPASTGHAQHSPDEVRAPLPTKVDRLYGDHGRPPPMGASSRQGSTARRNAPPVDIFKSDAKDTGSGPLGTSPATGGKPLAPVLSDLFKAPTELMYKGNHETAASVAVEENKWLMLNVQSSTEFDSHRLNRDTWAHEAVQLSVGGMFLFIQLQDDTPEGKQACTSYQLQRMPAILVLDPTTGAKLYERAGFIDAEHLLEDLVPFMDHGPKDPGAGEVAKQCMRRLAVANQSFGRNSGSAAKASGSSSAATHTHSGTGTQGGGGKALSEDEELALAIAMSMEGRTQATEGLTEDMEDAMASQGAGDVSGSAGAAAVVKDGGAQTAAAADKTATLSAEEVSRIQSEASARLGDEPGQGEPGTCRVMLRLPSGDRRPRRFKSEAPVQVLRDWVVSALEDAAKGRPFALAVTGPGGHQLTDTTQSLKAAGAEGAMVTVTWSSDTWP